MHLLETLSLSPVLGTPAWMWLAFLALVAGLLVIDLGLLHKEQREISARESLLLSGLYIGLGLAFGGFVWWSLGGKAGAEYLTGFAVEKTLALDNVFVIALIFAYFGVPRSLQHRVLFWGVLGVIVLRGAMIAAGSAIIESASWVLYLFALFLIATGVKMFFADDKPHDVGASRLLRVLRGRMRVTEGLHGERFFVRLRAADTGRLAWHATPLFLALVLVEAADVIFAVDSVPAIFAITRDPFVVYTSNIFAILGLRALYFALSGLVDRFHYLKYALALVLVFIGSKILIADLAGIDKIPPVLALGVTVLILAAGVIVSLVRGGGGGVSVPSPIAPRSQGNASL
ncbi:MAG: TerC family protein [Hyphomicrobiaceae bacterium]|nr:TerC family protein [Hyphomicrobiaceae bacterium]